MASNAVTALHGTVGSYRKGCRCDECREAQKQAKADYVARKALGQLKTGPNGGRPAIPMSERPHGDYVTYSKGCRCASCKEAFATYMRQWKVRRLGVEWPPKVRAKIAEVLRLLQDVRDIDGPDRAEVVDSIYGHLCQAQKELILIERGML